MSENLIHMGLVHIWLFCKGSLYGSFAKETYNRSHLMSENLIHMGVKTSCIFHYMIYTQNVWYTYGSFAKALYMALLQKRPIIVATSYVYSTT